MRQVVISSPGIVELREVPLSTPRKGEVRVRSLLVGICGSDLHGLAGNHPFIEYPYVPGHEVVGTVDEVGPEVIDLNQGARVILEPNLVCGTCIYCASGRYNLCEHLVVVGGQVAGAMAEAFSAPAGRFHLVPDTMSDAEAALVEPLSTAVHATRVAGNLKGRLVAVLGGGTIGLLVLIAARSAGAKAVAVSEPVASKRARALRLGASFCYDPDEADLVPAIRDALGSRPDVVFDCVASQVSTDQSIRLAEKGGGIVVVGVASGEVRIPLHIIQDREIRIEGSAMYVKQDVLQAIELMRDGEVPAHELVTATLPLAEAREAFELARAGDSVKVHVASS
jgi:2-desacetyl-2-hydroxyethyl bacteriochlorophyllide A dehydrogenase